MNCSAQFCLLRNFLYFANLMAPFVSKSATARLNSSNDMGSVSMDGADGVTNVGLLGLVRRRRTIFGFECSSRVDDC